MGYSLSPLLTVRKRLFINAIYQGMEGEMQENIFKSMRYLFVIVIVAFGLMCTIGSTGGDDEEDSSCSDTAWESATEYSYMLYLYIDDSLEYLGDSTLITNADAITVSGTIHKRYCSGETSGNFSFTKTFSSGAIGIENPMGFGYLYTYKIENDADQILVDYSITIESELGGIYELEYGTSVSTFSGDYLESTVHTSTNYVSGHYMLKIPLYYSDLKRTN